MKRHLVAAAAMAALFTCSSAWAWRTDRFCAPRATSFGIEPDPTDGVVDGDRGYADGYRFVFADGTTDVLAAMQAVKSAASDKLYLSFEIYHSKFDAANELVVAFDVGGTSNGPYKVFAIQPMTSAGPDPSHHAVNLSTLFKDVPAGALPGVLDTSTFTAAPAGVVIGINGGPEDLSGVAHWQVEMAIPASVLGANLTSATNDVGMYANMLASDTSITTNIQMRWPDGSTPAPVIDQVLLNLPQPSTWGVISLNNTRNVCTGVYMDSWTGDLYTSYGTNTNNGTDLSYHPGTPNFYHAQVHNSGTDSPPVTAQFKIANFGTTFEWSPPVTTDPALAGTCPACSPTHGTACDTTTNTCKLVTKIGPLPVPPGPATLFTMGPWVLDAGQIAFYAGTHQCFLVELDSTQNGTAFRTRSAYQNANFDVASKVSTPFEINVKGLPLPPGMGAQKFGYHVVPAKAFGYSDGKHEKMPPGKMVAQLDLSFHAYHYIGKKIKIRNVTYDIIEPAPGFQGTFQHEMPADFAKAFADRHADVQKLLNEGGGNDRPAPSQAAIARANALLKKDKEKPKDDDFQWDVDKMQIVGDTRGLWRTIEIPPNGKVQCSMNITAYAGGTTGGTTGTTSGPPNPPTKCCLEGSSKGAKPAAGFILLIGIWAYWRRRRD
jgi:hypothetical protein